VKHPSEDDLLKLKLSLLEPSVELATREHLFACDSCRERYQLIENDIGQLESFSLPSLRDHYPLPYIERLSFNYWWRAAAILTFSLAAGYATVAVNRDSVRVEPMQMVLKPPPDSLQALLSCTAIDLR